MDPGYNPDNRKLIEDNAALMNIPVRIFDSDIFDIVVDVEQSPCYRVRQNEKRVSVRPRQGTGMQ